MMQKLIRTTLFVAAALVLSVSTAPAQTTIFSETFDSDLGQFSQFSVASNANWTHQTSDGDGFAQINGFGADEASDDWLISSAIDLSGTTSEELTAEIGKDFDGPDLKLQVSTDYSGSGDPNNATWTEERSIGSAGTITVDLSGYSGNSQVYVAFQYTSTGTESGDGAEFTVDDVEVTSIEDPIVRFASATYTEAEDGGATDLVVELAGPDPSNAIDVDVAFNSGNSTAEASDFEVTSTTVSFSSSATSGDTKTATFFLTDDTSPEANKDAEFELTNLSSSGNASIGSPGATTLTIVDNDRTIDDARTALRNGNEEEVVLEGTVSRAFGSYARIQDDSGPTGASAIVIRQTSGSNSSSFQQDITDGNIQPGTQLRVQGTLSQFSGLIQIDGSNLTSYEVQGQASAPNPQEITLSDLESNGEDYESELVKITGLSFSDPTATNGTFDNSTSYEVTDGSTTLSFRVPESAQTNLGGESIPTGTFTFDDVIGQFNDFSGVDGDTGHRLTGIRAATALPVEMASFDAVQSGSSVELTWQTVSETNNAGFRVQRQTETGWTSLSFVKSKAEGGTTTESKSYRHTIDQELEPGTHQFRLKQEDLDGTTAFTDVVSVDVGLNEALRLSAPAPNPVSGQATVSFAVKEQTETTVSVYNVLGQQVSTLYRGKPSPDQAKDLTFNTSGLSSGVYFVRLQANGQTRTQRVTVVK